MGQLAAKGLGILTFVLMYVVLFGELGRHAYTFPILGPALDEADPLGHFTASVEGDRPQHAACTGR